MAKHLILLGGSSESLQSAGAFKVIATAVYANIPLTRKVASVSSALSLRTPPIASSDDPILTYGDDLQILAARPSALRLLGSIVPASGLLGETDVEKGQVDGWMSFGWSSLDLPLEVVLRSTSAAAEGATKDWKESLKVIDQHLLYNTYMVGKGVTVADIGLIVSLYSAAKASVWDPEKEAEATPNLVRWYMTLTHQDWFMDSAKSLKSVSGPVGSTAVATTGSSNSGVKLNGEATPVVNEMYRRHRIRIKEILKNDGSTYMGQTITVAGWARTIRKASSKLFFVELNDGSVGSSLQCVLDIQVTEGFESCKSNGGTGASFSFVGTIVPSQGSEQAVDLKVTEAKLLGAVYGGNVEGTEVGGMLYPMSKKDHTLEHMRDNAHLRARGNLHAAAMRVRHAMAYATHNFFHNHGFVYVHTPIITGADCEGAGEQFGITTLLGSDHLKPDIELPKHAKPEEKEISKSELKRLAKKKAKADPNKPVEEIVPGAVDYSTDFFCQRVNLTMSGQLNVETHACALSDVYTFGPTFRAEESRTYRHLSEFWMIEPEIAFADLADDINLAEDYLKYCVKFALENCVDDLEFFEQSKFGEAGLRDRLRNVLDNEFKRLTYTEAIEILQKAVAEGVEFEVKPEWGIDLPSEHERYICEKVYKQPVVLTDYPKEIKAFYMKLNEDNKTVAAADILVPKIGEIIGGSQREHRLDVLKERCTEMGLDPRNVWWYLDLRRYGTVPHAGFGLGFERLILFITGLDNIRDVIPFPRWVGNSKF